MQTYTFQLTGIKEGKPVSMYVTTYVPEDSKSTLPLSVAANRARRVYKETVGNESFTDQYIGDAERWFALMLDPYITPEDHNWLHSGETTDLWAYFTEEIT